MQRFKQIDFIEINFEIKEQVEQPKNKEKKTYIQKQQRKKKNSINMKRN